MFVNVFLMSSMILLDTSVFICFARSAVFFLYSCVDVVQMDSILIGCFRVFICSASSLAFRMCLYVFLKSVPFFWDAFVF